MAPALDLSALYDRLKERDIAGYKRLCREAFGCGEGPLDFLAENLTGTALFKTCQLLEKIRSAESHERPALSLGFALIAEGDLASESKKTAIAERCMEIVNGLSRHPPA